MSMAIPAEAGKVVLGSASSVSFLVPRASSASVTAASSSPPFSSRGRGHEGHTGVRCECTDNWSAGGTLKTALRVLVVDACNWGGDVRALRVLVWSGHDVDGSRL